MSSTSHPRQRRTGSRVYSRSMPSGGVLVGEVCQHGAGLWPERDDPAPRLRVGQLDAVVLDVLPAEELDFRSCGTAGQLADGRGVGRVRTRRWRQKPWKSLPYLSNNFRLSLSTKSRTSLMYGSSNWTLATHSRKGSVANGRIKETWPMLSRSGSYWGE